MAKTDPKEIQETIPENRDFNLNFHIFRLLKDEPFFAALSRRIDKVRTTSIPTAAITVDKTSARPILLYNEEFFKGLANDLERRAILKHEFFHVVFEHVTTRMPDKGMTQLWNVAFDLAINSHLKDELPKEFKVPGKEETTGCCIPGEKGFEEMPLFKSGEWYHFKLQQKVKQMIKEGKLTISESGEGLPWDSLDDHSGWDEIPEDIRQLSKGLMRDFMRKAAEEANKANNWGSIPSDMRKEIIDKLTPRIDWKKTLRYFVKKSQRANKSSTVKRINRRFPYIHPGRKANRTSHIAISIDESGSVSDQMLAAFYAELNKLSEIATFTVIPFDTRVEAANVYEWKKGQKKGFTRVACGGTDFDAPTNYVNDKNIFDGHIILTDLQAPKPGPSKCQRMWITIDSCARNPPFSTNEVIISIPEKDITEE